MANADILRPIDRRRRSPLYRVLEQAGATFEEINGGAVATDLGGSPGEELAAARRMAIADLCPLARLGCKGRGALDWVCAQGVAIGDANNVAHRQSDGALAARLADTEVLILDSLAGRGALPRRIAAAWSPDSAPGAWLVNRQGGSFWFMVTGEHAPELFATLCAVDLRPAQFPPGAVAQTSVARTNAIVIHADRGGAPAYHLLGDSASAEYLWASLVEGMAEFAGRPVGLEALRRLFVGEGAL